jgi:nicotinamidase-related amidase
MKNTALILIDIQNDYFPNGALSLDSANDAATKARHLLDIFRTQKLPIVHIQHETTRPAMGFLLPGTYGQKIHDSVNPLADEVCFTKHYPNAFWQTKLEDYLKEKNIKHLILAGMMTHMCVSMTAREAMERGFGTTIIQDACATRALEFDGTVIPGETVHKTALAELTLLSKIVSLNSFLTEELVISS